MEEERLFQLLEEAGVAMDIDLDTTAITTAACSASTPGQESSTTNSSNYEEAMDEIDSILFQDLESMMVVDDAQDSDRQSYQLMTQSLGSDMFTPTEENDTNDQDRTHTNANHHFDDDEQPRFHPTIAMGDGWGLLEEASAARADLPLGDDDDDDDASPEYHAAELLRRELKFLEAQRDFLHFKKQAADAVQHADGRESDESYREKALEEQENLENATQLRQMMMENIIQQRRNCQDLEFLVMQSPLNHYRLSLMTPMESYIHLGKDPFKRRETLLSIRDSKIAAARQFVEYQARYIDPDREFYYLDTFEKFGKFYTVDFSISKLLDTTVKAVADVILDHFVTTSDGISLMMGFVTNREFFDGIEETFLNARIVERVDIPKKHLNDRGFVVQESNTAFYMKVFDGMTVMTCDYVDEDELHPYRRSRIRKDMTVGITLVPHIGVDGVESVIMKRFSFIKHHLHHVPFTQELVQAISTRVILWGQAIRYCITRRRNTNLKKIWTKRSFRHRIPA